VLDEIETLRQARLELFHVHPSKRLRAEAERNEETTKQQQCSWSEHSSVREDGGELSATEQKN